MKITEFYHEIDAKLKPRTGGDLVQVVYVSTEAYLHRALDFYLELFKQGLQSLRKGCSSFVPAPPPSRSGSRKTTPRCNLCVKVATCQIPLKAKDRDLYRSHLLKQT